MMKTITALLLLALALSLPAELRAEHEGQVQILLLGDSTTEASIPRKLAPQEPQLEDVIYPRYAAEQAKGPNMLNYRRFPLAKIPEKYREFVKPFVVDKGNKEPMVELMDNRLDVHFGNLPNWFGDRHPNLAGYHVIGDETAKFLAPMIRAKFKKTGAK